MSEEKKAATKAQADWCAGPQTRAEMVVCSPFSFSSPILSTVGAQQGYLLSGVWVCGHVCAAELHGMVMSVSQSVRVEQKVRSTVSLLNDRKPQRSVVCQKCTSPSRWRHWAIVQRERMMRMILVEWRALGIWGPGGMGGNGDEDRKRGRVCRVSL